MTCPAPRGWRALVAALALVPVLAYASAGTVSPQLAPDYEGPVAQLPPPGGGGPPPGGQNAAPVITEFRAAVGPNGAVTFSGKVTDDKPVGGITVGITVGLIGVPAIVDADGNFSATSSFPPGNYTATAKATDSEGAQSGPRQTVFYIP